MQRQLIVLFSNSKFCNGGWYFGIVREEFEIGEVSVAVGYIGVGYVHQGKAKICLSWYWVLITKIYLSHRKIKHNIWVCGQYLSGL